MVVNILYDKIFLLVYFKGYLIKKDDYDFMFSSLQRVVYVLSIINLIMKTVLNIILYKKGNFIQETTQA
jgi:hypothetical protein